MDEMLQNCIRELLPDESWSQIQVVIVQHYHRLHLSPGFGCNFAGEGQVGRHVPTPPRFADGVLVPGRVQVLPHSVLEEPQDSVTEDVVVVVEDVLRNGHEVNTGLGSTLRVR